LLAHLLHAWNRMILFYIKELEYDVARKPLTLFGIML